jgi:hypothetical protein
MGQWTVFVLLLAALIQMQVQYSPDFRLTGNDIDNDETDVNFPQRNHLLS